MMPQKKLRRELRRASTVALALLAVLGVGCSVQIEKTLVVQDPSVLEVAIVQFRAGREFLLPQPPITLGGGTTMVIDVSTSLLDYLDGTVDGEVEVTELLFTGEGLSIVFPLGPMCIGLSGPSGGDFQYDVFAETASFDVTVDTTSVLLDPNNTLFAPTPFPFALEASMPLSLTDALGLFLGTGDLEVVQEVLQEVVFDQGIAFTIRIQGEVRLKTEDVFPNDPLVVGCIDRLVQVL